MDCLHFNISFYLTIGADLFMFYLEKKRKNKPN